MPLVRIADLDGPDAVSGLVQASKISRMYDQYVGSDPGNGHLRPPGIHASEVSGCKRRIVYNLLAYQNRGANGKTWRQRFAVGHAIHEMVQRDFYGMAANSNGSLHFVAEHHIKIAPHLQPLAEKWHIHSSTDGVFTFFDGQNPDPYLRVGVEIKTSSPTEYAKLTKPLDYHIDQVHVYMACLDIPVFWLFYWNKGNQNNTNSDGPFLVKFDKLRWARIEAKIQECHDYAYAGELPEREEGSVCQFCQYSYTCQPPGSGYTPKTQAAPWRP
jgi:CRISPR/Cas system-associated exonuclease Cas4 (RecB family)